MIQSKFHFLAHQMVRKILHIEKHDFIVEDKENAEEGKVLFLTGSGPPASGVMWNVWLIVLPW